MKRLLAVLLACCPIAAYGEDWREKLTPQTIGDFPPMRPLHAMYRFGWAKFPAASATFDYSKTKEGPMKLEVEAKTTGFVRGLWSMDSQHTAIFEPATLRPLSALQTEIYKKETLTTKLDFNAEGVARLRESHPPDKNPAKTKRFKFPGVLDLYGGLLFVRSQALQKDNTVRLVVYPATDPYLAEVKVLGREKVEVGKKKFDAIKLDLKLRRITKQWELEPHKKFKRATAWLTDDRDRLLLKLQAEIAAGSVWSEMESVTFSEP